LRLPANRREEEFGNVWAPTWRELTKAGMSGSMYQTHLMGAAGRVVDLAEMVGHDCDVEPAMLRLFPL